MLKVSKFNQLSLSHHEGGKGEFLTCDGPTGTLEFIVEVCKTANDAAKERLAPTAATFGGVPLLAEKEVVFAQSLGCFFGAHLR